MTEKPWILRDHEVKRLLSTGDVLVVRPVKPQPVGFYNGVWTWRNDKKSAYPTAHLSTEVLGIALKKYSPYPVGSRWWVREKWRPVWLTPRPRTEALSVIQYAADGEFSRNDWGGTVLGYKWESPILLSRAFSRLTVEVVEDGVGRVRELTYRDICRMGYAGMPEDSDEPMDVERYAAVKWLRETWDRHNPKYPYSSNPWVWSTRVRRVQ